METIILLDRSVFLFINHLPHTPLSDAVAMFLSGIGQWGAMWFAIALYLFFREEKRDRWFFLPVITAAATSEFIVEILIKPFLSRSRPGLELGAIIVGSGPGGFSFPSAHATLAFALAYVLSREEPTLRVWFFVLAALIGLSRMYLGVHYPTDVFAGIFLGIIIGWFSLMLDNFVQQRLMKQSSKRLKKIR